jgi:hypothetical protein
LSGGAEVAVVGIGANDLFLPYMHRTRPAWRPFIERLYRNGMTPCENIDIFADSYALLLDVAATLVDRVVCVGLPLLGEQRGSALNAEAALHNSAIERVAAERGLAFVDFAAWEGQIVGGSSYLLGELPESLAADARLSRDEAAEDALCLARGLKATVDGVHLTRGSAERLAGLIAEKLGAAPGEG